MCSLTVNAIIVLANTTTPLIRLVAFATKYILTVLSVVELFTLLLAFHVRQAATLILQVLVSFVRVTLQLVSQQKTLLLVSLPTLLSMVLVSAT